MDKPKQRGAATPLPKLDIPPIESISIGDGSNTPWATVTNVHSLPYQISEGTMILITKAKVPTGEIFKALQEAYDAGARAAIASGAVESGNG